MYSRKVTKFLESPKYHLFQKMLLIYILNVF